MLPASEKNPKISFLIGKIKAFLKENAKVQSQNNNTWRECQRKLSALDLPLYNEWREKYVAKKYPYGFGYYRWETEAYKVSRKAIVDSTVYAKHTPNNVLLPIHIDLTLLHILYNRLRKSTKFHLGTKEKDDQYLQDAPKIYMANGAGYKGAFETITAQFSAAYEVPLEAFTGGCHAS
jgi:hypothetical protein